MTLCIVHVPAPAVVLYQMKPLHVTRVDVCQILFLYLSARNASNSVHDLFLLFGHLPVWPMQRTMHRDQQFADAQGAY